MDKRTTTEMVYLDFSKAFDRVSHQKLTLVLNSFKLHPTLVNWISEFLSGRRQRTIVGDELSEYIKVTSGVPQGSVLGPLLFLMYIDSLLYTLKKSCLETSVFAFADDVKLLGSNTADIQKALNLVEVWSNTWQFTIQPQKSEHITYLRRPKAAICPPDFYIHGNVVKKVNTVKDLGIYVSSGLK